MRPKALSVIWMLLLTVGVIAAGYLSADLLIRMLPSYKQEIIPMEDKRVSQKLYGDNNQLSLYPWIYYDPNYQWELKDYEKKMLDGEGFNLAFSRIFDSNTNDIYDFTDKAITGLIEQEGMNETYIYYYDYYTSIFVKDGKIQDNNTGVTYQIDCAVADNRIVYFHNQPKDRGKVHREQLEHAYRQLSNYVAKDEKGASQPSDNEALPENLLPDYLKQVNTGTAIFPLDQNQLFINEDFLERL